MRPLIAVAALFAACGTSDSLSLDDYPDAYRDSFCSFLVRCGDVENLDTCRRANLGTVHVNASARAAIAQGKVEYHGDVTRACLDAQAAISCDVTSESSRVVPESCLQSTTGTLPADAVCALDAECRSSFCAVPFCSMACCTGTCIGGAAPARAKLGESCDTASCEDAAFCDLDLAVCVALKPNNASCSSPFECEFGLDCLPSGCGALPGLGAACSGACRDVGTTCSQVTGTCVKVALAGEACSTSQDCSPLYACDATLHCSAGPALGAACNFGQRCAADQAFCDVPADQPTGTCVLPKADGAACEDDATCESVYCDQATLLCAPEPVCT